MKYESIYPIILYPMFLYTVFITILFQLYLDTVKCFWMIQRTFFKNKKQNKTKTITKKTQYHFVNMLYPPLAKSSSSVRTFNIVRCLATCCTNVSMSFTPRAHEGFLVHPSRGDAVGGGPRVEPLRHPLWSSEAENIVSVLFQVAEPVLTCLKTFNFVTKMTATHLTHVLKRAALNAALGKMDTGL